jgi:hypothetical protein
VAVKKKVVKKKAASKKKVAVKKKAASKKKITPPKKVTPKKKVPAKKKGAPPKKVSKRGRVGEGRQSLYRDHFCAIVIRLGRKGKSKIQIASALKVNRKTLDNWCACHDEFSEAMDWARDLSQAWWENQGQKGIWDRNFNARTFQLQIANRFPDDYSLTDKVEISGPKGGPVAVQNEWILTPVAAKPRGLG